MLIGDGDSELNLLQRFDKSSQNVLAETIVGQDEIFRNQVLELHRLYRNQKMLMQEKFLKVSSASFVSPLICTSRHTKHNVLRERTSTCLKHEQVHIDLELPVSYNTDLSGDFMYEKCGSIPSGSLVSMNCGFDDVKASPMEELKLSLTINKETWKTCSVEKSREDQFISSPSQYYMNLKDSTGSFEAENQEYVPCLGRREISNVAKDVPQCSSESYESIVLKQPEISLDEYNLTSSTPSEVNCSNDKDYGTKLKRGRRMKDFRKEILPGLAALSRQEIYEDVRIMRGAIRSREYKKYGSKMRGVSDGFPPLKNKRSRHSRRCYS